MNACSVYSSPYFYSSFSYHILFCSVTALLMSRAANCWGV